jgi:hypothetical protein
LSVAARAEMSTPSTPLETITGKSSKVPSPTNLAYRIAGLGTEAADSIEPGRFSPSPPPWH